MKKWLVLSVVCVVLLAGSVCADTVTEIQVLLNTLADGKYTTSGPGTGVLTWENAASAVVVTDNGTYTSFDSIALSVTFSGGSDATGAMPKAIFTSGIWSVQLVSGGSNVLDVSGTTGTYIEEGQNGPPSTVLLGGAVATVVDADFDESYFGATTVDFGGGADGNASTIGIKGSTQLLPGISDYTTGWDSENVTVTFLANEQAIPEPMTLGILGLGGLFLRKRK